MVEQGISGPSAIALDPDGTSVYWARATPSDGYAVVRLQKGTAAPTIVATGLSYVNAMQVGSSAIFVTTADGRVSSISPKTGGGAARAFLPIGTQPQGLAIAGDQLYWTDWGGGSGGGAVHVAKLDGSGLQTPYGGLSSPEGIAVSGGTLVVTQFDQGHDVIVGSIDGGATTSFQTDPNSAPGPVVLLDGGPAIWGDIAQGGLFRLDLDGGQPQSIGGASGSGGITAVAVDDAFVYWVLVTRGGTSGTLAATTFDGARTAQITGNLACPVGVVADGQCVYWVNAGVCADAFHDYQAEAGTGSAMSVERPR